MHRKGNETTEYGKTKIKRPWWAFILVYVLFLALNVGNGRGAWDMFFGRLGLRSSWIEKALTLGASTYSRSIWTFWPNLTRYIYPFVGFVFSLFPALAFFFIIRKKKIPAIVFAAIFVVLSLLQVIAQSKNSAVYGLCWGLEFALAVCLLLYAILGKSRKVFQVATLVLVALGFIAYVLLMFTEFGFMRGVEWCSNRYFMRHNALELLAHSGRFLLLNNRGIGTALYPLSRVLMLAFGAVGFLMCKEKQAALQSAAHGKPKKLRKAILLSVFFGRFGVDRFYLGYVVSGILKLLTFGGMGVWTVIDVIRISTSSLRPRNGLPWYDKNHPYIPPQPAAPLSPPEDEAETNPTETQ